MQGFWLDRYNLEIEEESSITPFIARIDPVQDLITFIRECPELRGPSGTILVVVLELLLTSNATHRSKSIAHVSRFSNAYIIILSLILY